MAQDKIYRCSFCGRSRNASYMIRSCGDVKKDKMAYICDECVGQCNRILKELYGKDGKQYGWDLVKAPGKMHMKKKASTPHEIRAVLDEYVVGQEKAKKVLAVAVHNHRKRLAGNGKIKKSNILLAGPTGCGKTMLAQTIAKILDVPFIIADATSFTQNGYIGESADSILQRLLDAADGDVKKAQQGIVYLDEFDKLGQRNAVSVNGNDIGGRGVQQELLKIIEGSVVHFPQRMNPANPMNRLGFQAEVSFDTKDVLFICGGAFEGLTMETEKKSGGIGFRSGQEEEKPVPDERKVTPATLKKAGIIPELVGRLPVIAELEELGTEDLISILKDVNGSIIGEYKALFEADGVKLAFTDTALREVADLAVKQGTGARGLRAILEEVMLDLMYDIPSSGQNITTCTVTGEMVRARGAALASGA